VTRAIERSRRGGALPWVLASMLLACGDGEPQVAAARPEISGFLSPSAEPPAASEVEAQIAELERQIAELRQSLDASQQRETRMRAELEDSEARRIRREQEWMEYSQLLGMVSPARLPGGKLFEADPPRATPAPEPAAAEPPDPVLEARARAIERSLRTLLRLEEVRGIDLLECGSLEADSIGPVVFRLLDGSGRLAGSLYANRLRLEASRSAHTLTLVLEDGYESRGGQKIPFAGAAPERGQLAARRIVIDGIDPLPWAEDLRELFGESGLDLSGDDGLWDLVLVRSRLNALLKADAAGGAYRLRDLGGVMDGILNGVHLERLDERQQVERRLFADRLRITRSAGGVELILENGVQVRTDQERVPFLDGRYRILLPSADGEAWSNAGIPGLSPAPGQ